MPILTLIGTFATVVGVLVAVGVGPFDLAGDGESTPRGAPAASTQAPTPQSYALETPRPWTTMDEPRR
ncbi:hypothetical protein [Embleya scabrispora]|uniref:hypothetical protein n=1 Tax=Embleya scabrispora TaxID=159449 RepID=UPI00035F966B|nr:hypothetical protein [Embleya scabrispora]MYS82823.1 hypothetical protein [Streptomyces sp. SID5474]